MAPEVITRQYYTDKVDTWAVGVIVYKLFARGLAPFEAKTKKELTRNILNKEPEFDDLPCTYLAKNFIRCCLIKRRKYRYSAEDLLGHPWI